MNIRHVFRITHRDMGFAVSGLLVFYCLSGLALNHVDAWNPDFIIEKRTVRLPAVRDAADPSPEEIAALNAAVGEASCKVFESPAPGRLKVYYENASLLADLGRGTGTYEKIERRPVFYHVNVLHRNSLDAWKWMADAFALVLILITISGLFMNKGRQGLAGRGKWYLLGGLVPPAVALMIFEILGR